MKKFTINIDSAGTRLDKFLARNGLGFALAQKLLRQKQIKVNSLKSSADYKLQEGDEVQIFVDLKAKDPNAKPRKINEEKLNLIKKSVIYKDDNLLAIDKPSGIAVQAGNKNDFSIDAALSYLKFEKVETPKLVHRLDRDTSGILLIARNRKTAALLTEAFKNKTIKKTYLALISGSPAKKSGIISMPLSEKPFGTGKIAFKDEGMGKEAVTHYKILKTFDDYSLIELKPITGRMHQLRVHCKEIGHPIIGDGKYGQKSRLMKRLCLHSLAIDIDDFFGKKLMIETKKPDFVSMS
ncbi:MAG: pseudouridine synthase [Rickettsiaceae bacterium]|jgi:23S rRNA pseudouridine955/2504/2580 synthase|nr:pseudouridine synthase [Rickettsiaceae bacterium]